MDETIFHFAEIECMSSKGCEPFCCNKIMLVQCKLSKVLSRHTHFPLEREGLEGVIQEEEEDNHQGQHHFFIFCRLLLSVRRLYCAGLWC